MFLCSSLLGGCVGGPPASEGGFDSDDPASKLYAISRAEENPSPETIRKLVEHLDHDDPAVRMFAITALERITGQRKGYNPYAGVAERRAAIRRWSDAARDGEFAALAAKPLPTP